MNWLKYKDFIGEVSLSEEDEIFYGEVMNISDFVSFEGESVKSLIEDFRNAVDEYLEFCTANNKVPGKRYSSLDISPKIYNMAVEYANKKGLTLNAFVENLIETNILSERGE